MVTTASPLSDDGGSGAGSGDNPSTDALALPMGAVEVARVSGRDEHQGEGQRSVLVFQGLNVDKVQLGIDVALDPASNASFRVDNVSLFAEAPIREQPEWSEWTVPTYTTEWSQWFPVQW